MSSYSQINQMQTGTQLASYTKILLRWGWYLVLAAVLVTVCSIFIPDTASPDTYQATLQVQIELTNNGIVPLNGTVSTANAAAFFTQLFTSPDTLNLALPELHKKPQFHNFQLSDLQMAVTATPIASSNFVQLNVLADTSQNASTIVTAIYDAFLQRIQTERGFIVDRLKTGLSTELKSAQDDLNNSTSTMASLAATNRTGTFQYRLLDEMHLVQQKRVGTLNSLLLMLAQPGNVTRDIIEVNRTAPNITTVPGNPSVHSLSIALSPLVGLLMGLGGVILANRFSTKVSLRGKKRVAVLSHALSVVPVLPGLQRKQYLPTLRQASSYTLPILRRLHYLATEHERQFKLITVTSAKAQEGKSTVAASLAIAYAQSGLRTVLVDANTRRPTLHTWFQVPNTPGTLDTVNSLSRGIMPPSPTRSTSIDGLSLLPVGNAVTKQPPAMSEQSLSVDGLRPFADALAREADIVIFDGTALLSDADVVNLVMLSDMVLLVVDTQKSKSAQVVEAEGLLTHMRVSFITVLNRARRESVE